MKLTEWYSGDQKPARQGVYQRVSNVGDLLRYSYWDGSIWYYSASTKKGAVRLHRESWRSFSQNQKWRGVAK